MLLIKVNYLHFFYHFVCTYIHKCIYFYFYTQTHVLQQCYNKNVRRGKLRFLNALARFGQVLLTPGMVTCSLYHQSSSQYQPFERRPPPKHPEAFFRSSVHRVGGRPTLRLSMYEYNTRMSLYVYFIKKYCVS